MTTDSIARIDQVLLELRALGAEITNHDFGYPVEEATFEPGATRSRIETVAALDSEPLPADYGYFLSQCAGFVGMDFHNGYVMHTPEEVVRLNRQAGAPKRVATADGPIPVLAVAGDGGGNVFLLQLRVPYTVLRWDHETGEARDALPSTHPSLQPICDGFASLLERIREDWRHFLGSEPGSWGYVT
jgi:hypothetical protein